MNKHTHIIHKQTIEVRMPPGKSPFAVQEKIRQVYYDKILARLDGLFSELVTGDVIIRLDRLDLDLGPIDGERLEQDLVEKAIHATREILTEKLQFRAGESQGMEAIPVHRSNSDLVLYFLEYGRLPWWSRVEDLGQLESALMDNEPPSVLFRIKFRELIENVPVAGRRLLFQFSDLFLQFILSACFPGRASDSPEENMTWFKASYGSESYFKEKRSGENDKPPYGTDTGTEEAGPDATDSQKKETPEENRELPDRVAGTRTGKDASTNTETSANREIPPGDMEKITGETPGDQGEKNPAKPGEKEGTASPEESAGGMSGDKMTRPAKEGAIDGHPSPGVSHPEGFSPGESALPSQKEYPARIGGATSSDGTGNKTPDHHRPAKSLLPENRYSANRKDDHEPVYTELAGLVILHPFLSEFFTALHLMEGKSFRDEASRHKGVHLLGYLATGAAEIQEHRLVFPKLLCGMELANPVERMGVITQEEMKEAEQLLDTVITYWKALKSTSADGLRDSFLQRAGKLSRKEDGWQLDVEKKTLDILLGKLPWGFSIIKLPWITEMIFVNWG